MIPGADPRGAPTVLVVEDEVIIQMMLAETLRAAGFNVLEADNADAAMAALATCASIGVVVTDVRMPGSMDGLGLAGWMREYAPAVPIILTSGFSSPPDTVVLNPAIIRVVPKPYDASDIASWIWTVVGGSSGRSRGRGRY